MTTTKQTAYQPKVGDIFESSWGYDQTNVDYYEVVEVSPTGKTVKVMKIAQRFVERRGAYGDKVEPVPGEYLPKNLWRPKEGLPEPMRKTVKVSDWNGRPWFKVASYANAYLWDGHATYQTDTAFGH